MEKYSEHTKVNHKYIAYRTWLSAIKNKTVLALMSVLAILMIYAAFSGWKNFANQNAFKAKYHHQSYQDWVNNPDKHPHRMAHYGHFAFRPKTALSVFDYGLESYMGNSIYLEAHVQNSTNFSDAGFSTGLLRFGELSVAMVLQLLVPLFIFFIGFDLISKDRENGTLKIIFSQGVGWQTLIAGKSLGLLAVVMSLCIPVFLCMLAMWALFTQVPLSGDEIIRLAFLQLSYIAYFFICCVITVIISAVCRQSKTALVTLIGFWLFFAIVLPRFAQSLGTLLYTQPSKAEFNSKLDDDIIKQGDPHNPDDPHYVGLKDSLLKVYKIDSVQQLPFNYTGFQISEGERISAEIYNSHYNTLLSVHRKQNQFSKMLGFIDPFMSVRNLSMSLSNTDYSSYADFQRQAETYRYDFVQKMNKLHMSDISNEAQTSAGKIHVSDKTHWKEIDEFHYKAPPISSVFMHEIISLLAMLFWTVLLLMITRHISKTLQVV